MFHTLLLQYKATPYVPACAVMPAGAHQPHRVRRITPLFLQIPPELFVTISVAEVLDLAELLTATDVEEEDDDNEYLSWNDFLFSRRGFAQVIPYLFLVS